MGDYLPNCLRGCPDGVWSIVGKAIRGGKYIVVSYIARRVVLDVRARSPWSVVSPAIQSGAGQVAAGVTVQFTRPATPHITRHVTEDVIPQVICETTRSVVP